MGARLHTGAENSEHWSFAIRQSSGRHGRSAGGADGGDVAAVHYCDYFAGLNAKEHDRGENCRQPALWILLKISDDLHTQGIIVIQTAGHAGNATMNLRKGDD